MGTLSGESNQAIFIFFLPSHWRSTLKGKNLLPREQILSIKRRPPFGRVSSLRQANRKSRKLFPFLKMRKIPEVSDLMY